MAVSFQTASKYDQISPDDFVLVREKLASHNSQHLKKIIIFPFNLQILSADLLSASFPSSSASSASSASVLRSRPSTETWPSSGSKWRRTRQEFGPLLLIFKPTPVIIASMAWFRCRISDAQALWHSGTLVQNATRYVCVSFFILVRRWKGKDVGKNVQVYTYAPPTPQVGNFFVVSSWFIFYIIFFHTLYHLP